MTASSPADVWHGLLRPDVELAPAFWNELSATMRAAKLTFGDRVHCPFLRPIFLDPHDVTRVARVAERLADVGERVDRSVVSAAIDRWAAVYGVDAKLARALAWMESGFQEDVVSSAGAVGVMQLLPETWEWVDTVLLGQRTPRTYDGNVRAGVRYLRWQLDQFGGDVKLALAGYYQGARAVRERGLFDDTKQYVAVILELYGSV